MSLKPLWRISRYIKIKLLNAGIPKICTFWSTFWDYDWLRFRSNQFLIMLRGQTMWHWVLSDILLIVWLGDETMKVKINRSCSYFCNSLRLPPQIKLWTAISSQDCHIPALFIDVVTLGPGSNLSSSPGRVFLKFNVVNLWW